VEIDDLRELATLFAPERLSIACVGAQEDLFRQAYKPLQGVTA
jgi:hypothetical protein